MELKRFLLSCLCLLGSNVVADQPPPEDTAAPTMAPTATPWGGCVDPNDRNTLVTIGKPTTICLVLTDGPDWNVVKTYMRLNFKPIADEYSRFHVPECK